MKKFNNDKLLISSLKQYIYCKRRFSLMFIDCEWGSNYKIIEGDFLHERVNNPFFNEKRCDIINSRSVPVFSERLNLYGIADIVEFIKDEEGVKIDPKPGLWKINPIEYKNGKPENSSADNYQLCAVAMCLEEMFNTSIHSGDIYYGKLKRRINVELTAELKSKTEVIINEMQDVLNNQLILVKSQDQNCNLCSMIDICLPNIFDNQGTLKNRIFAMLKRRQS